MKPRVYAEFVELTGLKYLNLSGAEITDESAKYNYCLHRGYPLPRGMNSHHVIQAMKRNGRKSEQ